MNALTKRPGVITLLSDIQGDSVKDYDGRVLRVVGYFHSYSSENIIQIKDETNFLAVDCALLQPVQLTKGYLYHFIGEADWNDNDKQLMLKAHVHRCLEGLDFHNYKRTLKFVLSNQSQ